MPDGPEDQDDEKRERQHDSSNREDSLSEETLGTRLAEQKRKLEAARCKQSLLKAKPPLDPETSRGLGLGLAAAYSIIGLPLVGAGLGWLADRYSEGTTFTMIGVFVGIILGVAHAVHLSNRAS